MEYILFRKQILVPGTSIFYDRETENVYRLVATNSKHAYYICDVDACKTKAKRSKITNILEIYGQEHNHTRQTSSNLYRIHCLTSSVKILACDTKNNGLTLSEVYQLALDEFPDINLPNNFKAKMIKKICNARFRHRQSLAEVNIFVSVL